MCDSYDISIESVYTVPTNQSQNQDKRQVNNENNTCVCGADTMKFNHNSCSGIGRDHMDTQGKKENEKNSLSISTMFSTLKNMKSDNRNRYILNPQEYKERKVKSSFMGVYIGLLTALGGFLYGYDTGMINNLLEMKYVKDHFSKNGIAFEANELALLTGILSLGTFAGSLCSPIISDRYGRKFCMIWTLTIFFNIGVILQLCSQSIKMLLAGRFINGFGIGIMSSTIPLFQAEVSPKWIRGSIISFYQWAITWGLLVSSAISQGTREINDPRCFQIPIALQLIWYGFLIVGLITMPESPRFYVMKGNIDRAIISLSKLRRLNVDDNELVEELIEIKASYDYEISDGSTNYLDCFRSSPCRSNQLKRMLTSISLQAIQQCSGINFIFYYGVNFFAATNVNQSYLMSFITYAVNVVCSIPGILFVDKIGRRKMLIMGAVGMTISNYIIAIVGLVTDSVIANKVMIAFVCLFIAFFAATWGPIVWVVTGELFSLSIRQKAVSISASTNWIVNFIFAYSTPYLIDQGSHTAAIGTKIFFLWGSLNLIGLIITIFFVYETKGLVLEDVDELYRNCSNAFKSAEVNRKIKERNDDYQNNQQNLINENTRTEENGCNDRSECVELKNWVSNLTDDDNNNNNSNSNSNSKNIGSSSEFTADILSPLEHLNEWERKHQYDNILSDKILAKQSDRPPSDYDYESDDQGISDNEQFNMNGETGFSDGVRNRNEDEDNAQDLNDFGADLSFNYGLYGETPNDQFNIRMMDNNHNNNNTIFDTDDGQSEEEYHQNLEDIINQVSERSGIDLHPN